jgi:hypothetical protein
MIKFSRAALNGPRHDTPFCNSLCNVCKASEVNVHVRFRQRETPPTSQNPFDA